MSKRLFSLSALALSVAMALPAAAQDADTVVATVNGTDITIGHMIAARATLPQRFQELPDEVLFTGILDQLIQQTLLAQSFEGDLPKRAQLSLDNETRSLTAGEVIEGVLEQALTPDALQAAYDARFSDATPTEEYNASHILVETEEAAQAIKAELDDGAEFAAVAREKSTGPSGPNGGSLGWFGPGMMVPSFEAAVIALEPGEVSDPVKTQFGWHVITLIETRTADLPEIEEVRAELEEDLRTEAIENRVNALRSAADVDESAAQGIDPAILRDIELLQ
ncbi:peptidylprolyl isomerase [uncultured Tateyamaria sp.]|uniref:peptidylprolyl isomerase n=1 Tax=Tateyamaria sp. 1078 TaxID=3417464 RepID=UPI0026051DB6|nr:peptidylprolyl isomerase [uncultured Tateyamaria sp.]